MITIVIDKRRERENSAVKKMMLSSFPLFGLTDRDRSAGRC